MAFVPGSIRRHYRMLQEFSTAVGTQTLAKNMERLEVCRSDVMLLLFYSFFFNLFFTSSDFSATISCRYTSVR